MSDPSDKSGEPNADDFGHSLTVCHDGALILGCPEAPIRIRDTVGMFEWIDGEYRLTHEFLNGEWVSVPHQ